MSQTRPEVRCAVYIRTGVARRGPAESSSLDEQREAIRAFVATQKGWICLPEPYEDVGYSAGNLNRPALQRLLADVKAGKVDCVLVHTLDRLTRSESDEAALMAVFDRFDVTVMTVCPAGLTL